MDPLSITASAITLVAAAGSIATTVNTITRALRTADARLTDLTTELTHLTTFLRAVQSSLKGTRAYDLSHFDEDLWQQSEIALSTCQTTLNELGLVVAEMKEGVGRTKFGRRARLAAALNSRSAELAGFRDRIGKSNLALQTILHTITVSLSLRNNVSQSLVLQSLDKLKASIDRAMSRSWEKTSRYLHDGALHMHAESKMDRNLRDLAQAAKHFHSAASSSASSTASTARGDASDTPWQSYPGADMSLFGDFTEDRRERVEEFVRDSPISERGDRRLKQAFAMLPVPAPAPESEPAVVEVSEPSDAEEDEEEDESDDVEDAEFELAFLRGLQELITYHIRVGDYAKAITFINEATSNSAITSHAPLLRRLQIQLVLCNLLQGNWRLASNLLTTTLARTKKDRDAVVCSLLHALAIAHLTEYAFDEALAVCKMALYGRKRLCKQRGTEGKEYSETLGLFAMVYDMTGDYIRAEVLRGQLPAGYVYSHPTCVMAFLTQDETLKELLQWDLATTGTSVIPGVFEMDSGADPDAGGMLFRRQTMTAAMSPLRSRICEHERLELDTAKEVMIVSPSLPNDADDTVSMLSTPTDPSPTTPLRRRLTQMFRTGRPRKAPTSPTIEEDPNDSGYGTSSPTDSSTPTSPWRMINIGARRLKSKKASKKPNKSKPEKDSFKVLSMEKRAKVNAPKRETEWLSEMTLTDHWHTTCDTDRATEEDDAMLDLAELDASHSDTPSTKDTSAEGSVTLVEPAKTEERPMAPYHQEPAITRSSNENLVHDAQALQQSRVTPAVSIDVPTRRAAIQRPPRTIPSLERETISYAIISKDLAETISLLSLTLSLIPYQTTPGELASTWAQLARISSELREKGGDASMLADVEAVMTRLSNRRAWLLMNNQGKKTKSKTRAGRRSTPAIMESDKEDSALDSAIETTPSASDDESSSSSADDSSGPTTPDSSTPRLQISNGKEIKTKVKRLKVMFDTGDVSEEDSYDGGSLGGLRQLIVSPESSLDNRYTETLVLAKS